MYVPMLYAYMSGRRIVRRLSFLVLSDSLSVLPWLPIMCVGVTVLLWICVKMVRTGRNWALQCVRLSWYAIWHDLAPFGPPASGVQPT